MPAENVTKSACASWNVQIKSSKWANAVDDAPSGINLTRDWSITIQQDRKKHSMNKKEKKRKMQQRKKKDKPGSFVAKSVKTDDENSEYQTKQNN